MNIRFGRIAKVLLTVVAVLAAFGWSIYASWRQSLLDSEFLAVVQIGDVEQARELLREGASARANSDSNKPRYPWDIVRSIVFRRSEKPPNQTAVSVAAGRRRAPELLRLLFEHGADPNAASLERPLFWAARGGSVEAVKILLEKGADPSEMDDIGFTPLLGAVLADSPDTIRILLDHGADPNRIQGRDSARANQMMGADPERDASSDVRALLKNARSHSAAVRSRSLAAQHNRRQ